MRAVGAYLSALAIAGGSCLAFFLLCDAARGELWARLLMLGIAVLTSALASWAVIDNAREQEQKKHSVDSAINELVQAGERVQRMRERSH